MLKRADRVNAGDWVYFPSIDGYRGFTDAYPYGRKGSALICLNCPPCLAIAYPHEMLEVKSREDLYPASLCI